MRTLCLAAVSAAIGLTVGGARAATTESVLHSFGGVADGTYPEVGALAAGKAGVLYGTTTAGGANGLGVVFRLAPPTKAAPKWTYTVLHDFASGEGSKSFATLLVGSTGILTGTTLAGGSAGQGTVFRLLPPAAPATVWTLQTIWNFTGGADGGEPFVGVIADAAGVLYGTAYVGGASGDGVAYSLAPPVKAGAAWVETVLYSFRGSSASVTDGANPIARLALAADGSLYGTTQAGGKLGVTAGCSYSSGCGTVFHLKKAGGIWHETLLHVFGRTLLDGASPQGAVTIGAGGVLYGSTADGGGSAFASNNYGTVYSLTPPTGSSAVWGYSILKSMAQSPDFLTFPLGDLAIDSAGSLYGAAVDGGPAEASGLAQSGGGIFKLTPPAAAGGAWSYAPLHLFTANSGDFCKSGCYPYAGPLLSVVRGQVVVTGTTLEGGAFPDSATHVGAGVVYQLK